MNSYQIECALEVARQRSFTKAAQVLHISQPTLSSQIQKLEDDLGVSLFNRSTIPLQLTYAGERYVARAAEILSASESLEREMRDISQKRCGRIRIAITQGRMPLVLPLLINFFSTKHPNIKIEGYTLTRAQIKESVADRTVDFGVYADIEDNPESLGSEYLSVDLCREELFLAASERLIGEESLLSGRESTIALEQLSRIPLILPLDSIFMRKPLERLFAAHHVVPNEILALDDTISMYRLASMGFAAAIVPHSITEWVKPIAPIRLYRLSSYSLYYKLSLIYHRSTYIGEPERDLFSATRATLSSLDAFDMQQLLFGNSLDRGPHA